MPRWLRRGQRRIHSHERHDGPDCVELGAAPSGVTERRLAPMVPKYRPSLIDPRAYHSTWLAILSAHVSLGRDQRTSLAGLQDPRYRSTFGADPGYYR